MNYTDKKKMSVLKMTNGRCYYCGREIDINTMRMDHFKENAGSKKVAATLVPACPDCNSGKSDLTIEQFRERLQSVIFPSLYGRLTSNYIGVAVPERVTFYFEREVLE